jgi:hypothetical protein
MLLLKQVQDAKSLAVGGALCCCRELCCSQIMLLTRGDWVRSFGLENGISHMGMGL